MTCNHLNFGMTRRDFFGRFGLGLGGAALATASLKVHANPDSHPMSNVAEIQSEIVKLSTREMQEIRDWLENVLEDQLQLREEFESKIEQSERTWRGPSGQPLLTMRSEQATMRL